MSNIVPDTAADPALDPYAAAAAAAPVDAGAAIPPTAPASVAVAPADVAAAIAAQAPFGVGQIVSHTHTSPAGTFTRYGRILDLLGGDPEPRVIVEWLDLSGPLACSELEVVPLDPAPASDATGNP